ncbi:MAG: fumarylacetoacetate hydrolase family protein [Rhodomicrobium sp.]|nr:fumarylacetoacetate hydrolase family protein [Rhodomicrobium sp.]
MERHGREGLKFATIRRGQSYSAALIDPRSGRLSSIASAEGGHGGLLDLLAQGLPFDADAMRGDDLGPVDDAPLAAPIPRPARNIFCVGKNYADHARELASSLFKDTLPTYPIIFSKVPETVIGPGEPIVIDPAVSTAIDYEGELAVIIVAGGRNISESEAMSHVWGYTILNDVTARDLQQRHHQWLLGKSQDGFCPMGPLAVTADEIDLADTGVRTYVNGELRQDGNTRDLIFSVPTLIASISNGITLKPGDIIATGTPAGVGAGFDPPRFLKAGDVVRVEIDGIGALENPVVEIGQ